MRRNSATRVMIVEDVELEAKLVIRALADAGYSNVVHCTDAATAMAEVDANDTRLVITDLGLAGSSGIELTRRIRARAGDQYVYIIALTSRGGERDLQACFDAGVDDYVRKPFYPAELLSRLIAGERIVELERRLLRKSHELETALRRIDVNAAQRALASAACEEQGLVAPGATMLQALAATPTWRDLEALLAKATGELFQLPFESAPLANDPGSSFVAEITLSEPAKQLEISLFVVVDAASMSHLAMHLLGEDDRESSGALILELANVLMGVMKTGFAGSGFAFTGSLPVECTVSRSRKSLESSSTRSRLAIGTAGARAELWLSVTDSKNVMMRGAALREGFVICHDVHDARGLLLIRGGSRLTETAAGRLKLLIPDVELEVHAPAA